MNIAWFVIRLFFSVVIGCIFGVATKKINESKGYYGGFAWGFWLGIIGLLIVLLRNDAPYTYTDSIITSSESVEYEPAPQGGWTCKCGRGNAHYVTSCVCGVSKREMQQMKTATPAQPEEN